MKKTKAKAKISKHLAKATQAEQQGLLDLVAVMTKVAQRLESLEKKMEQVIAQTSTRAREVVSNVQVSNPSQVSQAKNGWHERVMYKAVCADCRKDCEVPFRPTGERPVYCGECFAKRKAERQGPKPNDEHRVPFYQQKPIKVMPKGTDKVTTAESIAAALEDSSKRKSQKAGKKSRR